MLVHVFLQSSTPHPLVPGFLQSYTPHSWPLTHSCQWGTLGQNCYCLYQQQCHQYHIQYQHQLPSMTRRLRRMSLCFGPQEVMADFWLEETTCKCIKFYYYFELLQNEKIGPFYILKLKKTHILLLSLINILAYFSNWHLKHNI